MSRKISDIKNPPPPPPGYHEKAVVEFLRKRPDEGFTFNEIVAGSSIIAGTRISGLGELLIGALAVQLFDAPAERIPLVREALEKLVSDGTVVRHSEPEQEDYFWLKANDPDNGTEKSRALPQGRR